LTHSLQHKGLSKILGLEYEIQYKRGSENIVADALSRRVHANEEMEALALTEVNPQCVEEVKESYTGDSWAQQVLTQFANGIDLPHQVTVHCGIIRKQGKLYVGNNQGWRGKMMQVLHNSSIGGHSGNLGTYQRVKRNFYWPGLKMDVLTHVQGCDVCQMNKGEHVSSLGLLEPIPIPNGA
jgi:Integrase zinc binding domain